ncbi:Protein serine phosphatase with GAF(S) sensor(S) [Frankia canadensis]|uniref:Protein serine phosphatase with GAF(S) sensor(S) n=1 Tax=Frankia canadensis TaxID=1836972 RepID=A0A2I2KWB4_9ACTN|nr:GAF domain-containing SpoIIE family protein phosphatase [Frankia canadensis]SNQ49945.1 Protein serine phosphatase with GAF(S) sensor(S) [Frankia canadensis]SOU57235.1 Protein serine phosphatase with GAF(S) sensor(S) [Frankia canadensis]
MGRRLRSTAVGAAAADVDSAEIAAVGAAAEEASLALALARSRRLLAVTTELGSVLTVDDVATVAFRTAVEGASVAFAGFVLYEDREPCRVIAWPRLSQPIFNQVWERGHGRRPGPAATADILRTGEPRFDATGATYLRDYPDRTEIFGLLRIDATATLPLVVSGRIIGVLSLGWTGPRTFDEDDRAFLRTLTGVYAQAIERARLHERQLSVTEVLQRAILPRTLPDVPGLRLVSRYLPAGPDAGIGGDWYDAVVRADGSVTLVVGDVGGHGLPAVSTMAELRHAARAYAIEGHPPAVITTQLSANLAACPDDDTYATAVVVRLEPDTGRLSWSCAGHPPPLLVAARFATFLDDLHGPMLGVDPEASYGQSETSLPPGARLLLYSDGLVERRGTSLTDRLAELATCATAAACADLDLDGLCGRVLAEIAGAEDREDDLCLLAVAMP